MTCREHFIAHMLLAKMTEGTEYGPKMAWAFNMMAATRNEPGARRKLNSKLYQALREKAFAAYGARPVSEDTRRRISDSQKRLSAEQMERKRQHARENAAMMKGKPCPVRLGVKPWNAGKKIAPQTPEQKRKRADSLRGCVRITNGWLNLTVRSARDIPAGFRPGRTMPWAVAAGKAKKRVFGARRRLACSTASATERTRPEKQRIIQA